MTPTEIKAHWDGLSGTGSFIPGWLKKLHPKFCKSEFIPQVGADEYYVLTKDEAKAEYHGRYGLPANVDLVWKDRDHG